MPLSPGDTLVSVQVSRIAEHIDLFNYPPWGCDPFSQNDVLKATAVGDVRPNPVPLDAPVSEHIARIAWLVIHGWNSEKDPIEIDVEPIDIDVGCPEIATWDILNILDGNHRICAAMVRKDETILCSVGGSVDEMCSALGIDLV
jgi:hypothetical protein